MTPDPAAPWSVAAFLRARADQLEPLFGPDYPVHDTVTCAGLRSVADLLDTMFQPADESETRP